MDELYLDNIDEFVHDHNKIVTYKWLSMTLGVHVNTAKQMLYHYLDHKRKESSAQLNATYLVSGKFVDNGQTSHRVSIVREDQLEDIKSKMSLIVSIHVYSVQKALLKDSSTLYGVDYDALKDNLKNCSRYSAIRCASAVPLSSLELQQVKERQQAPSSEPEVKTSITNGQAQKPSTKPQRGIMGMFANKPTSKNQDSSKEVKSGQKEDPETEATKSKPAVRANPMANFFGSQATKKPEKTVKQEQTTNNESLKVEQKPQQSPQPEEKQGAAAVELPKEAKKDSRSKTKRIEDSDSEEEKMEKKKRRRIKKPEPDSSDEDVIPDSPPQIQTREHLPSPKKQILAVLQSQTVQSETKTRKRRKVLKPRTFLDDEGCMVTEKVYESESYSEAEDDFQPSKQALKNVASAKLSASHKEDEKKKKASASANKGSKQASIMGFFQKK